MFNGVFLHVLPVGVSCSVQVRRAPSTCVPGRYRTVPCTALWNM